MAPPCPKPLDDALFATLEPVCGDLAFRTVDAIWSAILANGAVREEDWIAKGGVQTYLQCFVMPVEEEVAS